MKKAFRIAVVALFVCLSTSLIYAQEWTKEQSEVWKVVQDSWNSWKAMDIEGLAKFIHDKYQGWSDDTPLPTGKQEVVAWYRQMKDKIKVEYLSLEPARITVLKTAAVVDYYYEFYGTFTEGEKQKSLELKGKNAEFYVKEGDKWLLLGDMTVHQNDKDD